MDTYILSKKKGVKNLESTSWCTQDWLRRTLFFHFVQILFITNPAWRSVLHSPIRVSEILSTSVGGVLGKSPHSRRGCKELFVILGFIYFIITTFLYAFRCTLHYSYIFQCNLSIRLDGDLQIFWCRAITFDCGLAADSKLAFRHGGKVDFCRCLFNINSYCMYLSDRNGYISIQRYLYETVSVFAHPEGVGRF